jgi:hypothetical protein
MYKGLLLVASSIIIIGCSVREDREKCPCEILLDFSKEIRKENLCILAINDRGESIHDERILKLEDSVYSFYVEPSDQIYLAVASYAEGFPLDFPPFQLPYGLDYYKQYAIFSSLEPKGVLIRKEISLHKIYCEIEISFVSQTLQGIDQVGVSGNICGYKMDGSLIDGSFSCLKDAVDQDKVTISVPRQKDDSLELMIYSEGKKIVSFALGKYIADIGYDWTAEDLEDIKIEIDLVNKRIHLDSDLWTDSRYYALEI